MTDTFLARQLRKQLTEMSMDAKEQLLGEFEDEIRKGASVEEAIEAVTEMLEDYTGKLAGAAYYGYCRAMRAMDDELY